MYTAIEGGGYYYLIKGNEKKRVTHVKEDSHQSKHWKKKDKAPEVSPHC